MKRIFTLAALLILVALPFAAATNHTTQNDTAPLGGFMEDESAFGPLMNNTSNVSEDNVSEDNLTDNDTTGNETGDNLTDTNLTGEETEDNLTEEEEAVEVNVTANVSTVMLASTENYPDALIAGVASDRTGAPVLLTNEDSLPNETAQVLAALDPADVVIVGGPNVVSTNVTDGLEADYNVTRLWGMTQYGTAVEVAEYFWPEGAEQAVIAQDERQDQDFQPAMIASLVAKQTDAPLYLTPGEGIPAIVLASLGNLDVSEATVIGTNVTENTSAGLDALGIAVDEFSGENASQLREAVDATTRDQLQDADHVVLTAGTNFSAVIAAPGAPEAAVLHVENETAINETVTLLQDEDVTEATVVGDEDVGQELADRLENETLDVTRILGPADDVIRLNAEFVLQHADRFETAHQSWLEEREQIAEENEETLQERAGLLLIQVERIVEDSADANASLERAARLFQDEDYISTIQEAVRARNIARLDRFLGLDEAAIAAEIEAELQTVEQFSAQVRTLNEEFADVFEEAPVDDQLWIVESVRTVPPEDEQVIFDEAASTLEETEPIVPQFEEARDRFEAGNLTTNQTGNETGDNLTDTNLTDNVTVNETNVTNETVGNATGNMTGNETTNMTANETETGTNETTNETEAGTATVTYSSDGFAPQTIDIDQGTNVTWESEGPEMWVASAVHPTHAEYDGTERTEHCDNGSATPFDQCATGNNYSFTFNQTGEWNYHNHVEPSHTGTVVVQ